MAKGNEIIVSANPRGVFLEGIIASGQTPKPGTVLMLDTTVTTAVGGRWTYTLYNYDASGRQKMLPILLPDHLQGKTATQAYAAGDRCFLYVPAPGEELNMLLDDYSEGTVDSVSFGDELMVQDGTGKVIPSIGTAESAPFQALEAQDDIAADVLTWCFYTGY